MTREKGVGVRLTVNITQDTSAALNEVMGERAVTKTEALRRLVAYGLIVYRTCRDGGDVLVRREKGGETELLRLVE